MEKFLKLIDSKKIQWLIGLCFALFMLVVLPLVAWISRQNGLTQTPDTSLLYSSAQFSEWMVAYGEGGRRLYLILRWTFDLVYPLVYGLFFYMLLYKLKLHIRYQWVIVSAVAFDYFENLAASINVLIFPAINQSMIYLMQIFSTIKWVALILVFIIIIYNAIRKWINHEKAR